MCRIVSKFNDEASIINIAEINNSDTFSLKCLKSFNELIPALARVIPIAVTDKSPVPCTSSSGNVKLKITTTNTAGDFKNSGICPLSNIQPSERPENQPSNTANAEPKKNSNNVSTLFDPEVNNEIISKANTANNTPSGSTMIPSHFNILAGRGFSLDCRRRVIITVVPVTINNPLIKISTYQESTSI